MNIYEKLQTCRVELQNSNLKKSGKNDYAGYEYFELQDFMPKINELFLKYKLCGIVTFGTEVAELSICNIEKPEEKIIFTSPMAEASLKGCHPVQNLGAVETYQRRYLYMTALEITESDILDNSIKKSNGNPSNNNNNKNNNNKSDKATQAMIDEVLTLAKEKYENIQDFYNRLGQMEEMNEITTRYYATKKKGILWTVEDYEAVKQDLELPF